MNAQQYDPIVAAQLIESAHKQAPSNIDYLTARLEFSDACAVHFFHRAERYEKRSRRWRALAWALSFAMLALLALKVSI